MVVFSSACVNVLCVMPEMSEYAYGVIYKNNNY